MKAFNTYHDGLQSKRGGDSPVLLHLLALGLHRRATDGRLVTRLTVE